MLIEVLLAAMGKVRGEMAATVASEVKVRGEGAVAVGNAGKQVRAIGLIASDLALAAKEKDEERIRAVTAFIC